MTNKVFTEQVARLKSRFGDQHFDPEFCRIIKFECSTLIDREFEKICTDLIGQRPSYKPPILVDFREAKLTVEKYKFKNTVQGAAVKTDDQSTGRTDKGLRKYLDSIGCANVGEAIELKSFENKLKTQKG